jgi:hypothetical protein
MPQPCRDCGAHSSRPHGMRTIVPTDDPLRPPWIWIIVHSHQFRDEWAWNQQRRRITGYSHRRSTDPHSGRRIGEANRRCQGEGSRIICRSLGSLFLNKPKRYPPSDRHRDLSSFQMLMLPLAIHTDSRLLLCSPIVTVRCCRRAYSPSNRICLPSCRMLARVIMTLV